MLSQISQLPEVGEGVASIPSTLYHNQMWLTLPEVAGQGTDYRFRTSLRVKVLDYCQVRWR